MNTKTQKIVVSAMLAALVCVATMIIKIPSPMKGYMNLGDCVVLLCGWVLPPFYGFCAAGIGSALADLFSGYVVYAPATFLIKGVMALIAYGLYKALIKKTSTTPACLIAGVAAELFMALGYYIFEGFMYGFVVSLVNIPANLVQAAAGLILGVLLMRLFQKSKMIP